MLTKEDSLFFAFLSVCLSSFPPSFLSFFLSKESMSALGVEQRERKNLFFLSKDFIYLFESAGGGAEGKGKADSAERRA